MAYRVYLNYFRRPLFGRGSRARHAGIDCQPSTNEEIVLNFNCTALRLCSDGINLFIFLFILLIKAWNMIGSRAREKFFSDLCEVSVCLTKACPHLTRFCLVNT